MYNIPVAGESFQGFRLLQHLYEICWGLVRSPLAGLLPALRATCGDTCFKVFEFQSGLLLRRAAVSGFLCGCSYTGGCLRVTHSYTCGCRMGMFVYVYVLFVVQCVDVVVQSVVYIQS